MQWGTPDGWFSWPVGETDAAKQEVRARLSRKDRGWSNVAASIDAMNAKAVEAGASAVGVWAPPEMGGFVVGMFMLSVWSAELSGRMTRGAYRRELKQNSSETAPEVLSQHIEETELSGTPAIVAFQSCVDAADDVYLRTEVALFPAWSHDHVRLEVICADTTRGDSFDEAVAALAASLVLNP
ncbi:MAG: hypothetical protein LBD97_04280 [Bifidobacteriaceae bacterium]|nr:hypothetical protein [Bifidobacteriaceae bacterium]